MIKKFIFFLAILLIGCKTQNLNGRLYYLSNHEKEISLDFITDSTCLITQSYLCPNLSKKYKNIQVECFYKTDRITIEALDKDFKKKKINVSILLVKNKICQTENCINLPKFTLIDNYNEICSTYSSADTSNIKKNMKINEGIILNLVNDTLQLKKKEIIFGNDIIPQIK